MARSAVLAQPTVVERDGRPVIVIPMKFKVRGGRKEIILPPGATGADTGSDNAPVQKPLAIAVARAHRWRDLWALGVFATMNDLADRLELDRARPALLAGRRRESDETGMDCGRAQRARRSRTGGTAKTRVASTGARRPRIVAGNRWLARSAGEVRRLMNLTLLAPDLVEAILRGDEPSGLSLATLVESIPVVWEEQRRGFGAA